MKCNGPILNISWRLIYFREDQQQKKVLANVESYSYVIMVLEMIYGRDYWKYGDGFIAL
jgi:hypothetical protein